MNKYELIEKVYFDMEREGLKPEEIVHINEKYTRSIGRVVDEFADKITTYNGKALSQEQIQFAHDASCIIYNELLDQTKTVIIPAKQLKAKVLIISSNWNSYRYFYVCRKVSICE